MTGAKTGAGSGCGRTLKLRKVNGYFYVLPALVLICVFSYIPFIKTLFLSFFTINANNEIVAFAGLKNYMKVVDDPEFWSSVLNTFRYTVITVPVTLILAYIFALLCKKTRRLSRAYEAMLALPMAVSMSVATTIFNLMLNPNIGPVNHYLNLNVAWLTDKNVVIYTLCIIGIWLHVGMAFLFLLSAVRNVPDELLESARLDGASTWAQIINVYIPITSPTLFYLLCTNLASSMMMSDLVIALTQGGTSSSTTSTMIYYMYRKAFYVYNYGTAYASAAMAFIISFGLILMSFILEKKEGALHMMKADKNQNVLQTRQRASDIVIQVIAIVCGLIVIAPVLYCLSVSFMRVSEILSRPPKILPQGLYLGNYITALTKSMIPRYLVNSLIISLVCSIVRIITASLAGFGFAFLDFKGKSVLFYLVLGTMLIPGDVILTSNYFTMSQLGLVNTYLGIMLLYFVSANNIFMMRQHFMTVSKDLRGAAMIDGCGDFKFYLKILLPVSRPVLVTVFISSFISTWNMYLWPLIIANSSNEMRTVQVGLKTLNFAEEASYGGTMAGAMIILIPTLLVFLIFQRRIVGGMSAGSVKG